MVSVARTLGFGGINTKGIAMTMLVVVLIAGLFFIPEIINFQKGLSNKRDTLKEKGAVTVVAHKGDEGVSSQLSLWEKLTSFVSNPSLSPKGDSASAARRQQTRGKGLVKALDEAITWRSLKSSESVAALKRAAEDATAIAQALRARYPEGSFAIYRYVSGIRYVLGSAEQSMSAQDAVAFLEKLDSEVSDVLMKDKESSSDFNMWSRVTLGPAFAQSRILRDKALRQRPFDPRLRLLRVAVFQQPDKQFKFVANRKPTLFVTGMVEGLEARSITVYQGGLPVYVQNKIAPPNRFGQRLFKIKGLDARGLMLFRIKDKGGQVYNKFYNFYDTAKKFYWNPKVSGKYILPYQSMDPRLDGLFALNEGMIQKASEINYFTASVGQGFSSF